MTSLGEHQLCVPLMSWSLSDQHGFGAQPTERFDCGEDQQWLGINCIARNVIDQVGLEDHGLASHVDWEQAKTRGEGLVKLLGILVCIQDRNSRSLRALVRMIFGQKKRTRDGRASGQSGAANKKVPTRKAHCATPKACNANC